jgi:hypothetical protein
LRFTVAEATLPLQGLNPTELGLSGEPDRQPS